MLYAAHFQLAIVALLLSLRGEAQTLEYAFICAAPECPCTSGQCVPSSECSRSMVRSRENLKVCKGLGIYECKPGYYCCEADDDEEIKSISNRSSSTGESLMWTDNILALFETNLKCEELHYFSERYHSKTDPNANIVDTIEKVSNGSFGSGAKNLMESLIVRRQIPRIIGGRKSKKYGNPWLTSIVIEAAKENAIYNSHCGGSLISRMFVLTAAHCFFSSSRRRLRILSVRIGKWNLGHYEHDSSIDTKDIELYLHPYFDTRTFENDIALIRLKTPVLPNDLGISLINLPDRTLIGPEDLAGLWAMAAGWGVTNGNSFSSIPREVFIQIQMNCCKYFYPNYRPETQLCLLGGPGSDTCHGDSGGPIIVMDQRGPYLVGVISIGQVICGSDRPSVNTLVKPYIPWIIETILPYEPNFEKMLDKQRQYTPSNFEDY